MKKRILSLVLCAALLLSMCLFMGAGVVDDASDAPAESTAAAQVQAPQTVVYTAAGPFLPAVSVQPVLRAARASGANELKDGLNLSKTANADGSYKIRMEAFTTGKVTTTSTTPVDVVLVLDQSGSMAYDFNGNSTNNDTSRRQYAMKQAVNQFIGAVADKYDAEKSDHRISIVTFGSDVSVLQGWTPVSQDGKMTLQGEITRHSEWRNQCGCRHAAGRDADGQRLQLHGQQHDAAEGCGRVYGRCADDAERFQYGRCKYRYQERKGLEGFRRDGVFGRHFQWCESGENVR